MLGTVLGAGDRNISEQNREKVGSTDRSRERVRPEHVLTSEN